MEYFNHLKYFCEQLKKKRLDAGLTQYELGKRAGVHPALISKLENGVGNTTFQTINSIATYFGCSVTEMLSPAVDQECKAFSMLTLIEDILRMDEKKLKKVAKYVAKIA